MPRPFKCSCNKYFPREMQHCCHCGRVHTTIRKWGAGLYEKPLYYDESRTPEHLTPVNFRVMAHLLGKAAQGIAKSFYKDSSIPFKVNKIGVA